MQQHAEVPQGPAKLPIPAAGAQSITVALQAQEPPHHSTGTGLGLCLSSKPRTAPRALCITHLTVLQKPTLLVLPS